MGLRGLERRSSQLLVVALALLAIAADARGEVYEREEKKDSDSLGLGLVISPGAMLGWAGSHGLRLDGELSATLYGWDHFGIGVATGGNPTRFYAELQPVGVKRPNDAGVSLFVGLNPGVVVDWSGPTTRTGGQVTAWAWFMYEVVPFPFVPFARLEVFHAEHLFSVGLMLKFGYPVGVATNG